MNTKGDMFLAPYRDMVAGLNLSPAQDRELKRLYRRAAFPVRPWAFIFAGTAMVDAVTMLIAMERILFEKDPRLATNWALFMLIQVALCLGMGAWSGYTEKQLKRKIHGIKSRQR